jgi:hypothetical protein
MNRFLFWLITAIIAIAILTSLLSYKDISENSPGGTTVENNNNTLDSADQKNNSVSPNSLPAGQSSKSTFQSPLGRAGERITKKKFGQFITPQNSPVQPERFSGYHTGVDFEIFPEESNVDVVVKAVCDGKLLTARTASGYGGIAVQSCELDGGPVTIIYGHLNIASVKFKTGDEIKAGDTLVFLGAAYSSQTDGERKHLHLGIHKGSAVDIQGYVNSKSELEGWVNPCSVQDICQ